MDAILWAFKILAILVIIGVIYAVGVAVLIFVPGIVLIYVSLLVGGFWGGLLVICGIICIGVAIAFLKEGFFDEQY